ncbi:hybrid sensor histidine kinase/response regulator [Solimicrobium silvestre]|uniref:Chemotaxis protein CheA n=1 Tax=Solimicrobium silvestre TaxID=2099400 RepID=A0A2S9H5B6_9BURK|nr:response regulator [Solimicrobium silvestre]PRC95174.1 Response regulator receiver domain [Solimicrobium silvestre]
MTKDPYRYFRIEASELLDQLAKNVLDLEKGSFGAELVMRLLRLAHTLKGAARVVKQSEIADLAHGLEDTLTPYRDGAQAFPREHVDSVLAALDAIAARLAQLPTPNNPDASASALVPDSAAIPAISAVRVVRADLIEVDMLLEGLGEIGNELGGVRRAIDSMERIRNLASQISVQHAIPQAKLNAASEEMCSLLATLERNMSAGILRIDRELREARDAAERLRLVPIASIFNTLERTARDAANITGKQVEFQASGGDVRIEGTILDTVQSALIQLVRNAVAHGIEMKALRSALGKPAIGRITLEVERRGYRAWFRCKDDGAGVDLDAVRRALYKKGISPIDTEKLDAGALMALLLKGGISTTSVVTEISGRGIGLDLVREAMQGLDGEVVARTESGHGTAIELSVPLSLAALDVLIVENVGYVAALPLDSVRCTLRIASEEIVHAPDGEFVLYEGKQIPFAPLYLGNPQKAVRSKSNFASRALTAVVVATGDALFAVAVERLCGMDTVVLRALPPSCPADPIVLGVYLDEEGNPRMVLNPDTLVAQRGSGNANTEGDSLPRSGSSQMSSAPILIIDDSLTTRMLECSILESAGFVVEMAACAEDGLDMARRGSYALFLVDVEMPGMDGFSFVKHTQADPLLREVPSILVTSCNSAEDRRRGKECGARAYIVKGEFDQVEFLERVTELVQR